jgi:hypothetical protein
LPIRAGRRPRAGGAGATGVTRGRSLTPVDDAIATSPVCFGHCSRLRKARDVYEECEDAVPLGRPAGGGSTRTVPCTRQIPNAPWQGGETPTPVHFSGIRTPVSQTAVASCPDGAKPGRCQRHRYPELILPASLQGWWLPCHEGGRSPVNVPMARGRMGCLAFGSADARSSCWSDDRRRKDYA